MAKQNKRKKTVAKSMKKDDSQTVHHENAIDSVMEAQVCLKGFVKRGKTFSANLKQCHSDFQVA